MREPAHRAKLDSVDLWTDIASDVWQVEMADGAVCAMSVEALDASFERGEIGLHTRVQRPSGGDWRTLGEAAGAFDSMRPFATDVAHVDVPRPPPLPTSVRDARAELTPEELAVVPPPGNAGLRLAAVAAVGLLVGGVAAWRTMPAHPAPFVATTTIPAPTTPLSVAPPLAALPQPVVALPPPAAAADAPETCPAPEGNALPDPNAATTTASRGDAKSTSPMGAGGKASKGAKTKAAAGGKATTWKQRVKLNAAAKRKPA